MHRLATALLALMAGLLLGIPVVSSAQVREVNVYSSRHYDTDDQIYAAFTGMTGIRVNLIEGGEDQLIERIRAEGANSPADVLITVDAGRLARAQEAGVLQPVRSALLDGRIPPHLRDPAGHWYGFSLRARVVIHDRSLGLPAGLARYEDLARPDYRGMIST